MNTRDGTMIDRYHVLAVLGEGGMATVYLAAAQGPAGFHKLLVIKELRAEFATDPDFQKMCLDEARIAARLNHPNIVQTYEFGTAGARHFIAMEYLEGQSLHTLMQRLGRNNIPLPFYLRVFADTLAGLHHAHELTDFDGSPMHVVHRDVSPPNVMLTYGGQVKLLDFGIAKAVGISARTRVGVLKGRVAFMAPEQALGEPIDRRTDVFAVGVMLWEAVAGRRMWGEMQDVAMLHHLASGQIPSLATACPDANETLVRICHRALAPKQEDRYSTAAEFQHDLEGYLDELAAPVSARQLSSLLREPFAQDRAYVRSVIEQQLSVGGVAGLPLRSRSKLPLLHVPSVRTGPGGEFSSTAPVADTLPAHHYPSLRRPRQSHKRGLKVGAATVAVVLVGTTLMTRYLRGSDPAAAPSERASLPRPSELRSGPVPSQQPAVVEATHAQAPAPSAPAPSAVNRAPEVRLNIRVSPPSAQVFLDDVPLNGNPFVGVVPADGKPHRLRAMALGFIPREQTLRLDRDVTVVLSLERLAFPPAPPPAPPASISPVPATPASGASASSVPAGGAFSPLRAPVSSTPAPDPSAAAAAPSSEASATPPHKPVRPADGEDARAPELSPR